MGKGLFDGSDDIEDIAKIEIDEGFARRLEHNKKREELQRYEELKKTGRAGESEDNSSESEEEEDEHLIGLGKDDLKFYAALDKIKKRDPIIYQKDAKLFESEEEESEEEEEDGLKSKKKKPMYLKDVVAKHLIEEGAEFEEKSENLGRKSYAEEQEEIRRQLLKAVEENSDGEDGDLLKEKRRNGEDEDEEGDTDEEILKTKTLDECLGDLNEDDKGFMKDYLMNQMWIDKDKGKKRVIEDLCVLSEDEEEMEKQEKYEAQFNFRFEEGTGDRVLGHARVTEGSVRKKTNARKLQRKSKEERMAQEESERREELKHLKNLKKKEIKEKLEKIRASAGISKGGACALDEDDLEEDFDPDQHDRKMKTMFDVDYYDAEDADPNFCSDGEDLEKPDFDKEDELLGLSKGWDVCGSGDGFTAAREKILKRKADSKDLDISDDDEDKEEEEPGEGKRKRKRKIPLREKVAIDKELEEYYKLDYEDTIGDLRTRFKYASVPSQRYGLSTEEIIMTPDKDLNQYVSLKMLAPYREKEYKVPRIKRFNQKMKNKMVAPGGNLRDWKSGKKYDLKDEDHSTTTVTGDAEQGKSQVEDSSGQVSTESRKSRRKRRQAELKLSQARLLAYGKIPSTSKNKKKH